MKEENRLDPKRTDRDIAERTADRAKLREEEMTKASGGNGRDGTFTKPDLPSPGSFNFHIYHVEDPKKKKFVNVTETDAGTKA